MDAEREEPREELVECSCCHGRVPRLQIVRLGGRELCPSCANSWFDEEAD